MPERRQHPEMDDLLKPLDAISVPNRWVDVLDRGADRSTREAFPSPVRRFAMVTLALVVGVAGLGLVIVSFQGHGTRTPASGSLTSSALVEGGKLRCTATLSSSLVAGDETGIRFTVTNMTEQPVQVTFDGLNLGFILRSGDGTLFDSRTMAQRAWGGIAMPTTIAPHASYRPVGTSDVPIRWGGPLTVTPECLGAALAPLHAGVRAVGPPTTDARAIDLVVAASAHLLDACRPTSNGVPVDGRIAAPDTVGFGSGPPIHARCSITLTSQGNFSGAQVLILSPSVSPPDLSGIRAIPPYEDLNLPRRSGNAEAIVWDFVVTEKAAIPVWSSMQSSTLPSKRMGVLGYDWDGTRWSGGRGKCGGYQVSSGPGPSVSLVISSGCP